MGLIEFLLFVAAGYIVLTALVFVGYSALYGASAAEVRAARERIAAPRQGQPPLALDEEIKAAGAYIKAVRQDKPPISTGKSAPHHVSRRAALSKSGGS